MKRFFLALCVMTGLFGCHFINEAQYPFGLRGLVKLTLSDLQSEQTETPYFKLRYGVLRSEASDVNEIRGINSPSSDAFRPGLPSSKWPEIKYVTLVFECSQLMRSTSCGPNFPAGQLSLNVGARDVNLLTKYSGHISFREPSDWSIAAKEAHNNREFDVMKRLLAPESFGQMHVTLPLGDVVDTNKPKNEVRISMRGANGVFVTQTAQLQKAGSVQGLRLGGNAGGSGGGKCSEQADCCSNGIDGCTKVCTFGGECRDGECQDDDQCPSGHCRVYDCVECEKKEDCSEGQYCHTEGNVYECRPGGCDKYGNDDCPCGKKCNPKTHECEDAECNFLNSECGSKDCPDGQKCVPGGKCRPKNFCNGGNFDCPSKHCCSSQDYGVPGRCEPCECARNTECPPPDNFQYCEDGDCKTGCWTDEQCPGCTYCDEKEHICRPITKAGVKIDCPPGCDNADDGTPDDGGGTCFTADGNYGTCCPPGVCLVEGCGGKLCPDGRVNCLGECCEEGETCKNGMGCVPKPPACEEPKTVCGENCCEEGQNCEDGQCVDPPQCEPPKTECGDDCCEEGQMCENGSCTNSCQNNAPSCGGACCGPSMSCINETCHPNGGNGNCFLGVSFWCNPQGYCIICEFL